MSVRDLDRGRNLGVPNFRAWDGKGLHLQTQEECGLRKPSRSRGISECALGSGT